MEEAVVLLSKNRIKKVDDYEIFSLPKSYSKNIPNNNSPGSFWENRGDRHHCGVDIYPPPGSGIIAVENGEVIDVGLFTSSLFFLLIICSYKKILRC